MKTNLEKKKLGKYVFPLVGTLKDDEEYDVIMKDLKKSWSKLTQKIIKEE